VAHRGRPPVSGATQPAAATCALRGCHHIGANRSRCHRQHRSRQPWLPPPPAQPAPAVVFQPTLPSPNPHTAPHHTATRPCRAAPDPVRVTPDLGDPRLRCRRNAAPARGAPGEAGSRVRPEPPERRGKPRRHHPRGPHTLSAARSDSGEAWEAPEPRRRRLGFVTHSAAHAEGDASERKRAVRPC
jgi:hypothetical protein